MESNHKKPDKQTPNKCRCFNRETNNGVETFLLVTVGCLLFRYIVEDFDHFCIRFLSPFCYFAFARPENIDKSRLKIWSL